MWGGCGKVYGVSGEVCWRVGKGCGEGNGKVVGKCVEVWGPNTLSPHLPTLTFPYISPYLPHTRSHFPAPPFIPPLTSLLPPPTSQHIFLLSPHLPSPSQSVAKLPCDEVSVAKLLWRSYHVAKLLATVVRICKTEATEAVLGGGSKLGDRMVFSLSPHQVIPLVHLQLH